MDRCLFCDIISGASEASFVYKGKYCSAFLDLFPINPGHTIVIPNQHFTLFESMPEEVVSEMFIAAQKIYKAIISSDIPCDAGNIFISNGKIAGQEVEHCHLHVVPRYPGDKKLMKFISKEEIIKSYRVQLDKIAKQIKKFL
ncbi:MAG: HIT family protein [Halobacteriovoraceae bacterium]|nr:HIT family protein [Halobacteriovoraceae bacterium]MCB9095257.1 HIT family protein [Halobacteriovoraceae bacterium]